MKDKKRRKEGVTVFKSVFAKYITAATVIVLLSFLVLSSVITSMVASDASEQKKSDVLHVATLGADIVTYGYVSGEYTGLSDYLAQNGDIRYAIDRLSKDRSNIAFFVSNMEGEILLTTEGMESISSEIVSNRQIFENVIAALDEDAYSVTRTVGTSGSFIIVGERIADSEDNALGVMLAFTPVGGTERLVSATSRAIVLACLWIMIAILIAVYFLTERIVGPLKRMSVATKKYAKGRFDQRIEVVGRDEVAELAVAFNQMADEVDMLEQKRNQFLSDVSHELRSPMMSILGFVEGIKSGAIPEEKEDYYLDLTASEIKRLSRLVSDLLDVSRLQMGEKRLNFVKCNLAETVFTVMVSLEGRIEEKGLSVSFEEERSSLPILADEDALHRLLYNLVENAIKFSYEGGALRVSLYENKNKGIVFELYNEGVGISKEDLPSIFERFYKSDKSRSRDKKGVGLGLYFVKTILEAHGGEITCESEEGKYCTFKVVFPPYKDK